MGKEVLWRSVRLLSNTRDVWSIFFLIWSPMTILSEAQPYKYFDIESHANYSLLPHENCGDSMQDRIIGGETASLGQFPWMARLGYGTKNCRRNFKFMCGGSLVSERYIVTAAHCLNDLPKQYCPYSRRSEQTTLAIARLGEFNPVTNPDCDGDICAAPIQDIIVQWAQSHPDYESTTITNDFGIVKLRRDANLNGWVSPICLLRGDSVNKDYVNTMSYVSGWGVTENSWYGHNNIPSLQYLKLPVVDLGWCQKVFSDQLLEHRQICAGGTVGEDSCVGDSGGPLQVITSTDVGPRYHLLGVVSYGFETCGVPAPAVYTDARFYYRWFLDNM